jgi:hypothetical protein
VKYNIAVITPSYSNDFEYASDLCKSLDRHFKTEFEHLLIVPRKDMRLFEGLSSAHRRILSKEDLLKSYGFARIPVPTKISVPGVFKWKQTERWYGRGVGVVNGWTLQQILKLSAPQITAAEQLILVDSDVELFRDFYPEILREGPRLKLHQNLEGAADPDIHLWNQTARELLGLKSSEQVDGFNYIGQLIPWSREIVLELQNHLERIHGEPWCRVLARKRRFSEYILYALFCREILGNHSDILSVDLGLYNSIWTDERGVSADVLVGSLLPTHVALHIQSTIPLDIAERREIMREVAARAGRTDQQRYEPVHLA